MEKIYNTNLGKLLLIRECNTFYYSFAYNFENLEEKTLQVYTGSKKQLKTIAKDILSCNGMIII